MNINPKSDVLIVKQLKESDKSKGGLYLPEGVERDTIAKALILAAGPGEVNRAGQLIPHGFKVGETIAFDLRRAFPVTYEGEKYLFINAKEVFGTVTEEEIDA